MAIATVDDLVASTKRPFTIYKNSAQPTVAAGNYYSMWTAASVPTAGSYTTGSTTAGVIPNQSTSGAVGEFVDPSGNNAYLAKINVLSTQVGAFLIYDRCWHCGPLAFQTTAYSVSGLTVTRPASGAGIELWVEITTAAGGAATLTITYLDQNSASQTATVAVPSGATVGRLFKATLAQGTNGIQSVSSLTCSAAVSGNFNLILMRRIVSIGGFSGSSPFNTNWAESALPQLYAGSCLFVVMMSGTASAPTFWIDGTIAYN